MKQFMFLIKLNLKRIFRDFRYVFFIIILPVAFYLLYTRVFKANRGLDGVTWASYCMISLTSFGIIGNNVTSLGTRLSQERSENWYKFLKVSSISETLFNIATVLSYTILSTLLVIIMFITGFLFNSVKLSLSQYVFITLTLIIGSIVFGLLGLIISTFKSLAQPIGTILYLALAFIGGLFMPIMAMPTDMQHIAKLTPTYNYANMAWNLLGHKSISMGNVTNLIIYAFAFLILYAFLDKFVFKYQSA